MDKIVSKPLVGKAKNMLVQEWIELPPSQLAAVQDFSPPIANPLRTSSVVMSPSDTALDQSQPYPIPSFHHMSISVATNISTPMAEHGARQRALRLLIANGVDYRSLTPEQLSIFENQPPENQIESVKLFKTYPAHQLVVREKFSPKPRPRAASISSSFADVPAQVKLRVTERNYGNPQMNQGVLTGAPQSHVYVDDPPTSIKYPSNIADYYHDALTLSGTPMVRGTFQYLKNSIDPTGAVEVTKKRKRARDQDSPKVSGTSSSGAGQPGIQKLMRSKNGCLTCRQRRIKCDQRHMVCGPCSKSHRHCKWLNPQLRSNVPSTPETTKSLTAPPKQGSQQQWMSDSYSQRNNHHQVQIGSILDRPVDNYYDSTLRPFEESQSPQNSSKDIFEDADSKLLHLLRASMQYD